MKKEIKWHYNIGDRILRDDVDFTIINRKMIDNKQYYQIRCNKCGFDSGKHIKIKNNPERKITEEYWINQDCLKKIKNCPCCPGSRTEIIVTGINDIATTDPWMINYFVNKNDAFKYSINSKKIKEFKCPYCNSNLGEHSIYNFYKRKHKCLICDSGSSYPNRLMFNLLKQMNIDFVSEYSPKWIGRKRYDFYIPKLQLIIEMDGGLGHGNKKYKSNKASKYTIEDTIKIDNYKDDMANKHGIKVIRINCEPSTFDFIKENIINSELFNYFNINDELFRIAHLNSLKPNIYQCCELYNNETHDIDLIAKEIGLKRTSVLNFLHIGTDLGLCNYDNTEMLKKNAHANSGSFPALKVVLLNTLEIFENISQAEKQYKTKNISSCCKGKREYAGIHPDNFMPLVWAYYDDYLKFSKEQIEEKLNVNLGKGRNIPICLLTKEVFPSFQKAADSFNLKTKAMIKKCCENEKDSYGTYNGQKLKWMYYKDYIKLNNL